MFKIAATPTFKCKVKVDFPGDNGSIASKVFTAIFKRQSQAEIDEQQAGIREGKIKDSDVVDTVLAGWEDVADENGTPLEFNDANKALLMDLHPVRPTTVTAYFNAISGAKVKN